MKNAIIIGSGFGGLGMAAILAKQGYQVNVYEKNEQVGGSASVFEANGFRFDMGPSWYLMPRIFLKNFLPSSEKIFMTIFKLTKLDPSYRIFFGNTGKIVDMSSNIEKVIPIFEALEPGSGPALRRYLELSKYQYEVAKKDFLYRNYDSIFDFLNRRTMVEGRKLSVFISMDRYVRKFFKTSELQKIMQYTLVFLGGLLPTTRRLCITS